MTCKEFVKILKLLENYHSLTLNELENYFDSILRLEESWSKLKKERLTLSPNGVEVAFLTNYNEELFKFIIYDGTVIQYQCENTIEEILGGLEVKEVPEIVTESKKGRFILETLIDGTKSWQKASETILAEDFVDTVSELKKPTFFELKKDGEWWLLEFYPVKNGIVVFDHDDEEKTAFSDFNRIADYYALPDEFIVVEKKEVVA